jgi:hypothetical protein
VILVCWLIIVIVLIVGLEVRIRRLSIHSFSLFNPLPSASEIAGA